MNLKVISFFLVVLLLGSYNLSYSQTSSVKKENVKKEENRFDDHFKLVDSTRSDLHEINFIGGYSFKSNKGFWGKIPSATLSIYAIRYNRKLFKFKERHLLEYVAELNLAANYTLSDTPRFTAGSFTGWGITPLGFQLNFWSDNIVQPFFKSSAGFMYFNKQFPDSRGVKFNFTLELGGGLEFIIARHLSFTLGYKYHHMSNAQFGDINPGIDSNIFYSGFTVF